jgi:hypothetical protein
MIISQNIAPSQLNQLFQQGIHPENASGVLKHGLEILRFLLI